jgi:hypothetical protein
MREERGSIVLHVCMYSVFNEIVVTLVDPRISMTICTTRQDEGLKILLSDLHSSSCLRGKPKSMVMQRLLTTKSGVNGYSEAREVHVDRERTAASCASDGLLCHGNRTAMQLSRLEEEVFRH